MKTTSQPTNANKKPSQQVSKQQVQNPGKREVQIDFSEMDPERQKCFEVLQKLLSGFSQMKEQNRDLTSQIQSQMEKNKQLEEEHKQNLLHVETLNMMTKYQLVFIKLETSMHKILQTIDQRKRLRMKKALMNFKYNAMAYNMRKQNKNKLVVQRFRNVLENAFTISQRFKKQRVVGRYFRKWNLFYLMKNEEEKVKSSNQRRINELQQDLVTAMKRLEQIIVTDDEQQGEIKRLKLEYSNQSKYLEQLEGRAIHLNNEYIQLLEKQSQIPSERLSSRQNEERYQKIEQQIQEVELENKTLRESLDQTNGNMSTFIRDMSGLLDSHELQSIIQMDPETEDDEEHIIDYEELRPHAGTGGSSQLRSRPNYQPTQAQALRPQINSQNIAQQQISQGNNQGRKQNLSNRVAQIAQGSSSLQQNKSNKGPGPNYHSNRQNR